MLDKILLRNEKRFEHTSPIIAIVIVWLFACGIFLMPSFDFGNLLIGGSGTGVDSSLAVFDETKAIALLLGTLMFRLFGLIVLGIVVWFFGLMPNSTILSFCKFRTRGLFFCIPFLVVVVFNMPIIALTNGNAKVLASGTTVTLFVFCTLLVTMFEEVVFRGLIFLLLIEVLGVKSKKNEFFVILISSAIFGLTHLVNLIGGGDVGAVMLQVAYSFGIGAMCAASLIFTKNIIVPIILHFIFNLGGTLIDTLGEGNLWDVPTIIMTVIFAVVAAGSGVYFFCFGDVKKRINTC